MSWEVRDEWFMVTSVLKDVLTRMGTDITQSSEDPVSQMGKRVYSLYYRPVHFGSSSEDGYVGFIDSGFKVVNMDTAAFAIVSVGSTIRRIDGAPEELLDAPSLLGADASGIDLLLIYVSRVFTEGKYTYRVEVKALSPNNFLLKPEDEASVNESLSIELERFGLKSEERANIIQSLLKYLIQLIELAYAVKVMKLSGDMVRAMVLDGTLLRWFTVGKAKPEADGLTIVELILRPGVGGGAVEVKRVIRRIYGLSKTTSLTGLLRAHSLFREAGMMENAYAEIREDRLSDVGKELNDFLEQNDWSDASVKAVKRIVKRFNARAYRASDVYVLRFPIMSGPEYVFMLDLHSDAPVIEPPTASEQVRVRKPAAVKANKVLREVMPKIFSVREAVPGYPPHGFMSVDQVVRMGGERARSIEKRVSEAVSQAIKENPDLGPIIQLLGASILLRHGYR